MPTNVTTVPQLKRLWQRRLNGESTAAIAADIGCSVGNLARRWRLIGIDPMRYYRNQEHKKSNGYKVWVLRKEGKTYREIAMLLGYTPDDAGERLIYMRLVRYCKRTGVVMPRVSSSRPASRATPQQVHLVEQCIRERARQELHTSWPDIAEDLKLPGNIARMAVASLRRRGILAGSGLAPTAQGMREWETLPLGARRRIMEVVTLDWVAPDKELHTLGSLVEQLGLQRATLNSAICRLREANLLEPRGTLSLR
jgi:hypothetical protein